MYDTYLIKENDTLSSIISKFNTTENILNELNNYNLSITPGNTIIIPKKSNPYFDYYTITKGDTLTKISNDNNINPKLLAQLNGLNEFDYIYPNQVLIVPKAGTILYITTPGDTLDEVSKIMKSTISELITQNQKIYLQPEQLIIHKYE